MFNNRLNITYDNFVRNTIGFLAQGLDLPAVFGANPPSMNVGDMRTKGFELSVNWKDVFQVASKPFNYNFGFVYNDYDCKDCSNRIKILVCISCNNINCVGCDSRDINKTSLKTNGIAI